LVISTPQLLRDQNREREREREKPFGLRWWRLSSVGVRGLVTGPRGTVLGDIPARLFVSFSWMWGSDATLKLLSVFLENGWTLENGLA
jgi:hypothetical protein